MVPCSALPRSTATPSPTFVYRASSCQGTTRPCQVSLWAISILHGTKGSLLSVCSSTTRPGLRSATSLLPRLCMHGQETAAGRKSNCRCVPAGWTYALESGFLEMLLQSEHRTLDPEEAGRPWCCCGLHYGAAMLHAWPEEAGEQATLLWCLPRCAATWFAAGRRYQHILPCL